MLELNIVHCTVLLNIALRWCGATNWVCDLYLLNVMIVSWYARCLLRLRAGGIMDRRGDHQELPTEGPTEGSSEGGDAEVRPLQNSESRKQKGRNGREFLNVSKEDSLELMYESKMGKYFVLEATIGTRELVIGQLIEDEECYVLANGKDTKQTEGNTVDLFQDSEPTTDSEELMYDSEENYIDVMYRVEEVIRHLHRYQAVTEYIKQMTQDVMALDIDGKGINDISDGLHDSKQETGEHESEGIKQETDAVKEEIKELNTQLLPQNTVAEETHECEKRDSKEEIHLVDRNTIVSNQEVVSTKIHAEDKNKVPNSPMMTEEVENEVSVQLKGYSKDDHSSIVYHAKNDSYNWNNFVSTAGFNFHLLPSSSLIPYKAVPTDSSHTQSRKNSINNSNNTNEEGDDLTIDSNNMIHQDTTNTPPHQTLQNGAKNINKFFGKSNRSRISYWLRLDANPAVSQDSRNKQSHLPLYDNNNRTKRSSQKHEQRNESLVELNTVSLDVNGGGCLSRGSHENLKNNQQIIGPSLSARDSKEEQRSLDSDDNDLSTADHETYKEEHENECPPTLSHDHNTDIDPDNYKETMNPDETTETEYETPMFQDHNTDIDEEKDNAYTQNNVDKIEDVYFKDERNEDVDFKDYNSPHREPTLLSPTKQNNNSDKIPDEQKKEYETKEPEEVEDSKMMDVDILNKHYITDLSSSSEVVVEDSDMIDVDILNRHKGTGLSSSSEVVVKNSEILDVVILNKQYITDLSSSSEVVVEDSEMMDVDILNKHKDKNLSSSSEVVVENSEILDVDILNKQYITDLSSSSEVLVEDSEMMDVDILNKHYSTDLSSSSEVVVENSEIMDVDILNRHKGTDLSSSSEVVDSKDDNRVNSLTDKVIPPFCGSDRESHRQNSNYLLIEEKTDMKDRPLLLTGNFTITPFCTECKRDTRTQNEMGVSRLKNRSGTRDNAKGSTGDGLKRNKDNKNDKDMDLSVTEQSRDSNEDDHLSVSSEDSRTTLNNSEKRRVATVTAEAVSGGENEIERFCEEELMNEWMNE